MGRGAPPRGARRLRVALLAFSAGALLAAGASPALADGPPTNDLTVTLAGLGAGGVTSSPAGIDCGTTCTATFDATTVVTLTATPAAGSRFAGWSGACTGTAGCAVTMSDAAAVTATFDDVAAPAVAIKIDGGIPTTRDGALAVSVTATDNVAGDLVVRAGVGLTGTTIALGDPQPYAPTLTLTLASGAASGSYTVLVEVSDASSNAARASATIVFVIPDSTTVALAPSYSLTAVLDYVGAKLTVTEKVTVTNGSDQPIGTLRFSALAHAYGELSLSGPVTVDGAPVTPTWPNSAELRVPLAADLAPGAKTTVVIPFVATPKTDIGDSLRARFSKVVDTHGVVMLQVSSWYPLLSTDHGLRNPGDAQFSVAAPVTMKLDYPSTVAVAGVAKALRLALPGVVKTVDSAVAGRYIATVTLAGARELAFAASPRFVQSSATSTHLSSLGHAIKVTAYYLPGESGLTAAGNARNVLDKLTATYGTYPYDRFIVARSTRSSSGNEYSGIVFLGSSKLGSTYAVAHEVAHQWFYHLVGNDQLVAPWLDEGFAEYTGRLAVGIALPSYCSSLPVDETVYAFANKPADSTCGGYIQTVYYKACAMLNGIRSRLGSSAFAAAMRSIVSTYRGKVATEAGIVAIFEHHASNPKALDAYLYAGFLTPPS